MGLKALVPIEFDKVMMNLLRRCVLPATSTRLVHANFPVASACVDTALFAARQFSSTSSPASTTKSSVVWVGGLPFSTTASEIKEHFQAFGTIEGIKMQATANGAPKGTALITFSSPKEAVAALVMDRKTIGSRWMAVKLHQQKSLGENAPSIKPSPTIWIGGLPFETTDAVIHDRFGGFGSIANVELTTRFDGKPSGMCYVTFESPEAAEKAAASMNKATFGSRFVHVKVHHDQGTNKQPRKAAAEGKKIREDEWNRVYFGNIPFTTTETELADIFASCGELTDLLIFRDKQSQRSRGHGFAQYKDASSVAAAIRDIHGTIVGGRDMSVELPRALRGAAAAVSTTTVHVMNLPVDLEDDTLRSMFEHCGSISQLRRASDNQSALLVFDSRNGAQEATGLAGSDIDGRVIDVQLAVEENESQRR